MYGRVSRYGLIAFASSLDRVGPFAGSVPRTWQDYGGDRRRRSPGFDRGAAAPVPNYLHSLDEPVKGLPIGVPTDYFAKGLDAEARDEGRKRESRCSSGWGAGA